MGNIPPSGEVKTHPYAQGLCGSPRVGVGVCPTFSSGAVDLPVALSIGILAWNEETAIGPMLESLFGQSIFRHFAARGQRCEVICLANGCTDRTVSVANESFARVVRDHPDRAGISARTENLPAPGRNATWNRFIHEFSAPAAQFLCVMDADIIFNRPDTIALVVHALEVDSRLGGASDWPVKDVSLKPHPSLRERVSLATSDMTGNIVGRLNGMLYCLRAPIARNLYLPRDLGANDDGFFKAAICTNFFRAPLDPTRVVSVRAATHLYEPYVSFRDVLNNQKRQMIGQTTVHVIIDYLQRLPLEARTHLAHTLRQLDASDPDWLNRLVAAHLARVRYFWRLFPHLLTFRWTRYAELRGKQRLTHLPPTLAGMALTLVASWQAARFLRRGCSSFWPKTVRRTIQVLPQLNPK